MSEYVPTTGEMRSALVYGQKQAGILAVGDVDTIVIEREAGRQFDAWLLQHDREVAASTIQDAIDGVDWEALTLGRTATGVAREMREALDEKVRELSNE